MGNVIGKVFDKYVQNQIKTRQTTLGHLSRSDKELQLLNNSTAFLRLASSVDISQNVAENLGYPNLSGKKLAQKLILWNGVSSLGIENIDTIEGSGILSSSDPSFSSSSCMNIQSSLL